MKSHSKLTSAVLTIAAILLPMAPGARAALPEPDHIVYGTPTQNGEPLLEGVVTAKLVGETDPIASYVIGSNPNIGDRFALRIPIDSIDPRLPGTARTGEAIRFFIDGIPAGEAVVGERGSVLLLDIDQLEGGLPAIAIADLALYEGNAGTTIFAFQVTLSEAADEDVTFDWQTAPGTALGGLDFVEVAPGTLGTIGAGDTTTTLSVTVLGETFEEDNETFFVNLSNPSANAIILDGQGVGTILDDDRPPAVAIADLSVVEGDAGTVNAVFDLTTSRPINQAITVNWTTADGSATTGDGDYVANSGVATFDPNVTATQVTVLVNGDEIDEDDESFFVNLSGVSSNATISDGQASGTILDDDGFLTWIEAESLDQLRAPLFGASGVAVSPDGDHVYVTGRSDDGIALFDRDPVGGALGFVTAYYDGDVLPSGTVNGLDGAEALVVSPDGEHVYVVAYNDSAIAVFDRDPASGLLEFVEAHTDNSVGGLIDGLAGATSVAISPDGAFVYVAGTNDDAIVVFSRQDDSIDPDFGKLTYVESKFDGGPIDGLDGVQWVEISPGPNGPHLYAASGVDKAVAVFSRNLATGALTFVEAEKDGIAGVNGLDGANSLAVSNDGRHVYVTGPSEDALALFSRNDATGALTYLTVLVDGVGGADGLDGAMAVRVSFDNRFLYVCGFFEDALAVYDRDPVSGLLSYREIHRDGFGTVEGLARANAIAVSTDDQHLYVAGQDDDMVAVFMRDAIEPSLPTILTSTSHTPSVFSNDPTVDMLWSGATDNPGGSGLDGYSFLFDGSPLTNIDGLIDLAHTVDPHTVTSPGLADGTSYYFHFRVCDKVGNCTPTVHLGPYWIDQTAPTNPVTISSTTHSPPGTPTANDNISMIWSAGGDALSGVDGFSYAFTSSSSPICDQVKSLEEGANGVTSADLADGSWFFHLCTVDNAGNWSAPATRGPYVVEVVAPQIVALDSVADLGDDSIDPGDVTATAITQIYVDFSEPMDAPTATDPANYLLVGAGPDSALATTVCGPLQGDDIAIPVNSATWYGAMLRAVLQLNGGVSLPASPYRLLICGARRAAGRLRHTARRRWRRHRRRRLQPLVRGQRDQLARQSQLRHLPRRLGPGAEQPEHRARRRRRRRWLVHVGFGDHRVPGGHGLLRRRSVRLHSGRLPHAAPRVRRPRQDRERTRHRPRSVRTGELLHLDQLHRQPDRRGGLHRRRAGRYRRRLGRLRRSDGGARRSAVGVRRLPRRRRRRTRLRRLVRQRLLPRHAEHDLLLGLRIRRLRGMDRRALIVAFGFLDFADGGAQRLTLAACRPLARGGVRPVLVCARGRGRLVALAREQGLAVETLGRLERPWDLGAVPALAARLRALGASVLHVPLYSRASPYLRLAARRANTPLVVAHEWGRAGRPRLLRRVVDRLLRPGTRFVATSEAHRRELLRSGVAASAIAVVRSGIEIERFGAGAPQAARAALGLPAAAPIVLVPARLHPMKGHRDLLAAMPPLSRRHPELVVLCAGEGPAAAELRACAAAAGLGDSVRFLGHREDIPQLLAAADLVALPSRAEGLPAALLEAYAAGRAVVATAVGGIPEALVDGREGRLVPPADPAALGRAIGDLLAAPGLRAEMGASGRSRVVAEYRVEATAGALAATYRTWLEEPARARPRWAA